MTDKPLDLTKPVQTRDGRKVRILCTDRKGEYPVIGLVERDGSGIEEPELWTLDGLEYSSVASGAADLINVPEKQVLWVNLHRGPDGQLLTSITTYPDELSARTMAQSTSEGRRGFPHVGSFPIEIGE